MDTEQVRGRRWRARVVMVGIALPVVAAVAIYSFQFLPSTKGWSKDVAATNEMSNMKMLIQLKADPTPPVAGAVTLMARVKDEIGYTARVNQVLFTYSQASQGFTRTKEGMPVGKFGTQGEGIYTASAELPFPGDWQIEIAVNHGGSKFVATFPFEVKAQQ